MSNDAQRKSTKAFSHAMEHLENAKQDISLAENIIKAEQERSQTSKRKEDEREKHTN